MEKLTTFKHTKDGMLVTEDNNNPYIQVKEVKEAFAYEIYTIKQRQSCWGKETDNYKEYDRMIEEITKFYNDMFN